MVTVHLGYRFAASFPPLSFLLDLSEAGTQTPDSICLYQCPGIEREVTSQAERTQVAMRNVEGGVYVHMISGGVLGRDYALASVSIDSTCDSNFFMSLMVCSARVRVRICQRLAL
jgi:hypothetical protein